LKNFFNGPSLKKGGGGSTPNFLLTSTQDNAFHVMAKFNENHYLGTASSESLPQAVVVTHMLVS